MYPETDLTRVLVVDDDPDILEFMEAFLLSAQCEVRTAQDGETALARAHSFRPHIVFLDIMIPEQDGWLVCSKLKTHAQSPLVVLMTGYSEGNTNDFARFVHADELLRKPFTEVDLLEMLHQQAAAR
jgi:CheY-like chemotaxis protein